MTDNIVRANRDPALDVNKGKGPAIQTLSGRLFHILDPQEDDVTIMDIAHGLSMQCRYNGQIPEFYSVAQHSVIVAEYMERFTSDKKLLLKALMHDAHEAYLGDVVTPLKVLLPEYREIEDSVDDVICNKFGIPRGMSEELHKADKVILATEIRDLRPQGNMKKDGENLLKPVKNIKIVPVSSSKSYTLFLEKYLEYTEQ